MFTEQLSTAGLTYDKDITISDNSTAGFWSWSRLGCLYVAPAAHVIRTGCTGARDQVSA